MLIKEVLEKNQVLRQQKETPKSLIIFYILLSGVFLAMVGIEVRRIIRYFV
jgi:hypothetical protein